MKNFIFIFILYISLTSITAFADNTDDWCLWANHYNTYSEKCNNKVGYDLYNCRVLNLCTPCTTKDSKKIFETEEYKEIEKYTSSTRLAWANILDPFNKVKDIYKANMNSIYKCVLLDVQERWLKSLEDFLSSADETGSIWKELNTKISSEKTKIKTKKSALKCWWSGEDKSDSELMKKEVLDQLSLEFCTYIYYLEYMQEYYSIPQNALWVSKEDIESASSWGWENKEYETSKLIASIDTLNSTISLEKERTFKIFPLAYYAYSEYEDNYILHLFLTLIKQDYVIVREQLAKVLWPINQVVYKIKDAMKNY